MRLLRWIGVSIIFLALSFMDHCNYRKKKHVMNVNHWNIENNIILNFILQNPTFKSMRILIYHKKVNNQNKVNLHLFLLIFTILISTKFHRFWIMILYWASSLEIPTSLEPIGYPHGKHLLWFVSINHKKIKYNILKFNILKKSYSK